MPITQYRRYFRPNPKIDLFFLRFLVFFEMFRTCVSPDISFYYLFSFVSSIPKSLHPFFHLFIAYFCYFWDVIVCEIVLCAICYALFIIFLFSFCSKLSNILLLNINIDHSSSRWVSEWSIKIYALYRHKFNECCIFGCVIIFSNLKLRVTKNDNHR